jgi:hypothetical protein
MIGACGPYNLGGSATLCHLPSSLCKSRGMYHPSSTAQKHIGRSMAIACCTSGWRGQKLNAHYISAPQGKLFTPDKEEDDRTQGHVFSFIFFPFHLFTTNVTRALSLGTTKGEAGATFRKRRGHTSLSQHTYTPPKRHGICSLSRKLVTPTMSTSMQGNTSNSRIHWT